MRISFSVSEYKMLFWQNSRESTKFARGNEERANQKKKKTHLECLVRYCFEFIASQRQIL